MIKTTLKFNAGIPYYRRLVIGYLADNKIKILKIKSGFIHSKIKELKEKQWKKYQDIG